MDKPKEIPSIVRCHECGISPAGIYNRPYLAGPHVIPSFSIYLGLKKWSGVGEVTGARESKGIDWGKGLSAGQQVSDMYQYAPDLQSLSAQAASLCTEGSEMRQQSKKKSSQRIWFRIKGR